MAMYGLSSRPIAPVPSSCLTTLAGKLQDAPPLAERNRTRALAKLSTSLAGGARLKARQNR
jgi:hypothetical protein